MKQKKMIYFLSVIGIGVVFVLVGVITSYRISLKQQDCDIDINITIGHVTDTHFRNNMDNQYYQNTIDELNALQPNMIIFTGDMFQEHDISESLIQKAKDFFNRFEAEYLYAVLGNHDYYSDTTLQIVTEILEEAGFTILINTNDVITINNQTVNVIGLDDLTFGNTDYQTILETSKDYEQTIVLSHEPDSFDDVHPYPVQVMFSGHSHGGQIRLPGIGSLVNVPGAKVYHDRTYLKNGTKLYISFGLGQSLINIRMYNPHHIEFYKCS